MKLIQVSTHARCCFVDITTQVRQAVDESGVKNGMAQVYVPHTTAGVTINENADPDVPRDILGHLASMVPEDGEFMHSEGNSDAHIKTLLTGSSVQVPIEDGKLVLGVWQSVFFAEYDGPRNRKTIVNCLGK